MELVGLRKKHRKLTEYFFFQGLTLPHPPTTSVTSIWKNLSSNLKLSLCSNFEPFRTFQTLKVQFAKNFAYLTASLKLMQDFIIVSFSNSSITILYYLVLNVNSMCELKIKKCSFSHASTTSMIFMEKFKFQNATDGSFSTF